MNIAKLSSPNFNSRRGQKVQGVVFHYTGGSSASGSVRWMCDPSSRVSAHYVIARSGRITKLVDLNMAAWHAGVSEAIVDGESLSNANLFTIGVEFSNCGYLHRGESGEFYYTIGKTMKPYAGLPPKWATLVYDNDNEVSGYWEPYREEQYKSALELLQKLEEFGYPIDHLWGHEEIAMPFGARKSDPGPLFEWERFERVNKKRTRAVLSNGVN